MCCAGRAHACERSTLVTFKFVDRCLAPDAALPCALTFSWEPAPWCGHCKAQKPEVAKAAESFMFDPSRSMAAVDCIEATNENLCQRHQVKAYPTFIYFSKDSSGEAIPYSGSQVALSLVEFLKAPPTKQKRSLPPPLKEPAHWREQAAEVCHVEGKRAFQDHVEARRFMFVMFYAPWCTHCTRAKPEFAKAAKTFADDQSISFVGVDCDNKEKNYELCREHGTVTFPMFKFFDSAAQKGMADPILFEGGRKSAYFGMFVTKMMKTKSIKR